MAINYYQILGIRPGASPKEIKKAYHKLSLKWHPDSFDRGTSPAKTRKEAEEKFKEIKEAYDILTGRGGGGPTPDEPKLDTCDRCGKDYDVRNKFPEHKQGKGENEYYHFCSKTCYNCLNVCDSCGKVERLSKEEEKNNKIWTEKGWGSTKGKIFCSPTCRQKLEQKPNNSGSVDLPNCHHCGKKDFPFDEQKKVYTTYGFYERDEVFCSTKCREEWGKINLGGRGNIPKPTTESTQPTEGGTEITEEDNSNNNSPPNSDDNSNNIPEPQDENDPANSNLPQDLQVIANLSLPQAQIKAEQEIEKLLKDNALSGQELDTKNLLGKSAWRDYLKKLDTSAKVADFTNQMRQAILKKSLTKKTSVGEKEKPQDMGFIKPIAILVFFLLIITTLIIIIRKKSQRRF